MLVLAGIACGNKETPKPDSGQGQKAAVEPKEVTLATVTEIPIEQTIAITGTLDPDEQVTASAKVPGRLASIAVDLASPVTQGQVIAQIETKDYEIRIEQAAASLAQARAQLGLGPNDKDEDLNIETTALVRQATAVLREAEANRARARKLSSEGLITAVDLDAAETAAVRAETALQSAREEVRIRQATVKQRRSELRLARQQLTDTLIKSPLDGVVQMRRANAGEYLPAGAAIADLVRIDPLRLRVALPELEAADVRQGQPVRVRIEGDETTYAGTVARIAPSIDPKSRTLLVESDIKNPGHLRPGSLVQAEIVVTSRPAPTVPETSIVRFAGLSKVITIENGKAKEQQVTTGKKSGDRIEIIEGIKVGETVVEKPGSLQQGQPVRVLEGGGS
ncbi:MAG: efflux RND transporter periplasmic adaptor subunit [Polyangiaceae bacterium]|nr:efflux RND transporter periplasmic adaptor subunit [Polyangiaceae bacterium]